MTFSEIPESPKGVMLRAGVIVSLLTLLSRVLGLARDSLLAVLFGAGHTSDAFFIALRIPNLFRRTVAEGSLATAAVPLLTRAREKEEFRETLGAILACALPIAAALTLVGIFYSRELTLLLSPGLGTELELVKSSEELLKILSPFVIVICVTAILGSALNVAHKYALASLPSAISNLFVIGALIILYFRGSEAPDISKVAWAFLLGSTAALIPLFIQLFGLSLSPKLCRQTFTKTLSGFFPLFGPALFSSSLHQILSVILSLIASMLPVGTISCLYFADRVYQFSLGVFSVAIATAALPRLSELRLKTEQFNAQLTELLRWVTIGVLPATVGIYALAAPIIRLIYEHGNFSATDALNTASALQGYCLGLWPISIQVILVRAYLAKNHAKIPAISSVVALLVTPILAFALMGPPSSNAGNALALILITFQGRFEVMSLGQFGIALSSGLGMLVAVSVLAFMLKPYQMAPDFKLLGKSLAKSLCSSLVMAAALFFLEANVSHLTTLVCLGVPLGAIVYGLCSLALGNFTIYEVKAALKKH